MIPTWSELAAWLPDLFIGWLLAMQITAGSLLLGIPLGLVIAVGIQAKSRVIRSACLVVVEIGRGTPALVVLQFMYFGLPTTGIQLTSFATSVVALGWNTGAYTSEIIRAGLQSVPHGQLEAAAAAGLSRFDAFWYIILPQGIRVAAPALLGFSILLFQGTSLCFTIAVPELVSRAYEIGSNTFRYFPVLLMAGALYAIISIPASLIVRYAERRAGSYTMLT